MKSVNELKKIFMERSKFTQAVSQVVSAVVEWANILNKPSVFPPDTHTHVAADITDLVVGQVGTKEVDETDIANGKALLYNSVTDKLEYETLAGSGDMMASVYDPNTVAGDAFDMENMVEGATKKILTGADQTINGVKTFGSFPVTPSSAPTTDYQVANKKYVDDNSAGAGLPAGGTSGQLLVKQSSTDGDATWQTLMSVYDSSEAAAYFAALTTPLSGTQEGRITDLIIKLKELFRTNDLSTRLDCLYLFANETAEASLLNLIKRSHDCTNVHSTAWVQWEGYTGDGTNDYLDTNYNPSTQGVALSQNNASMGIYCRSNNRSDGYVDAGCSSTGTEFKLHLSWTDGNQYLRCFSNGGAAETNDNTIGMFIMQRSYSTTSTAHQHLTASDIHTSFTVTSTAPPNYNVYVCGSNNAGTLASPSAARQYSIFFIGSGLTKEEETRMMLAFETYMDSIGKGVI